MDVLRVYHRRNPLWHFTVVGRPPAEDSSFGYMIHNIVKPLTPAEFPGVVEIHAVDAAGVHPLLLAIGKERYMPFRETQPEEILTIANHILGSGQTSLAKFLFIAAEPTTASAVLPPLSTKNIPHFFNYILERIDLRRDIHFHTKTTIDTLDYSGTGWNAGSKVVIAAAGQKRRELSDQLPDNFKLPAPFNKPIFVQKGILAVKAPKFASDTEGYLAAENFCKQMEGIDCQSIPLILLVDDSEFTAASVNNFVWSVFTRANPSHDMHGIHARFEHKHWGCETLVIDARKKPHHAPELVPDPQVSARVDKLFAKGGDLAGLI
jgi:4-hydroxy-3-polyprenylbenzoate decarboxylase